MPKQLAVLPVHDQSSSPGPGDSRNVLLSHACGEFVLAVVGHVGSGTSEVARQLKVLLESEEVDGNRFDVEVIKAREVISPNDVDASVSPGRRSIRDVEKLQDRGDKMREGGDYAAIARGLIQRIRGVRAKKLGQDIKTGEAALPDGKPRAYILDSIRHPAEVELLRRVYDSAFALIGVVCEPETRLRRISKKYSDAGNDAARDFMKRDEKSNLKHGQRVSDAFHLADYFVDNTLDRFLDDGETSNPNWGVPDELSRLIKILLHSTIVRPSDAERAMYAAEGARAASACLSRQVGACLVDQDGSVVATGTNEVPKAGGGTYGDGSSPEGRDGRCAYRDNEAQRYCSNTHQQNILIKKVSEDLRELLGDEGITAARHILAAGQLRGLLEFSRAVHAEMNALLRATRAGRSTKGSRLFVTTFPCHYCARHLIAAGVAEVQYIEPYPKSLALELHRDAIRTVGVEDARDDGSQRAVLFRPFTGVAPRLYSRAFTKDRDLKDDVTGKMRLGPPEWGTPWHVGKISYVQLEAELSREMENAGK